MSRQAAMVGTVLAVMLAALAPPATAEITSIAGFAQAEATEFRSGAQGDTDRATESFPGTAAALPLQVIAQLVSSDPNEEAAAAVAAQFADPRELAQPNPEEFAINLALNSVSPNVRYQARAISRETRGVLFSAGELGALSEEGDTVDLTGRLFLDGALTLLAVDPNKDLTGASVLLRVTVVQSSEGQQDQTVFSGAVELRGTTGGDATVVAEGNFPTTQLIRTNLAIISQDFAAFHVLIIPNITIDYSYSATVGQPFTLRATVEVEAANVADESGVAAVIGTPTDTLTQVIGLTQGQQVAANTVKALSDERENPTGEPAFPPTQPFFFPLFPFCGALGFEALIGVAALVGLRRFASPHRYSRK
ncbi:MAG: hypothetical protein ACE5I3_06065 [Phycisphaerae bacterium]